MGHGCHRAVAQRSEHASMQHPPAAGAAFAAAALSAMPQGMPGGRALRVAVVTETFPPEVNGVAATISRVVQGLCLRGHAVQLVRPLQEGEQPASDTAADGDPRLLLVRGMPIPHYPSLRMGLPARSALVRAWREEVPDIVHIVTEGPLGWSALRAARQLQLPVVSDFRTNFHAYSLHYGIAWLRRPIMAYLRHFHHRTAVTMVPTESMYALLTAVGLRDLRVVGRGVDVRQFDPCHRSETLRRRWGAEHEDIVVLCVGRLAAEKNLSLLIEGFEALRTAEPRARLVLVGDGPERAALQERCPQAIFAGTQRGDALSAHYASADVFVFPSLTETFGNVVPEAMASGLPVVAFDEAAAHQLVRHGDNGYLAPVADRPAFVSLTRRLAGEHRLLRHMGRLARETALLQDWSRIVEMVEAVYVDAMRRQGQLAQNGMQAAVPAA